MGIVIVAVCLLFLAAAIVMTAVWGGMAMRRPWVAAVEEGEPVDEAGPSARQMIERMLWTLVVAVISGIGAGILVAGAGGRLVMRLLTETADPTAMGKKTEAEQVVGAITVDGTLGFIIFTGLFFGLATGLLYVLLQQVLPPGRWSGVAFGAALFVVGATRAEPLRPGNEDFDIVGPAGVAVVAYAALVLVHGMAVAAIAGRVSSTLPLLEHGGPFSRRYLWLVMLAPVAPVMAPLLVVGALIVLLSRSGAVRRLAASPALVTGTRVALVALVLVALPWTVGDLGQIFDRG